MSGCCRPTDARVCFGVYYWCAKWDEEKRVHTFEMCKCGAALELQSAFRALAARNDYQEAKQHPPKRPRKEPPCPAAENVESSCVLDTAAAVILKSAYGI